MCPMRLPAATPEPGSCAAEWRRRCDDAKEGLETIAPYPEYRMPMWLRAACVSTRVGPDCLHTNRFPIPSFSVYSISHTTYERLPWHLISTRSLDTNQRRTRFGGCVTSPNRSDPDFIRTLRRRITSPERNARLSLQESRRRSSMTASTTRCRFSRMRAEIPTRSA